jgi:hypothetical protein
MTNNSATRIHNLLSAASKQPDSKPVVAGWIEIFGVEEKTLTNKLYWS